MTKRSAILGNGRMAAVFFVFLVIFLSASIMFASNPSSTAQPNPTQPDETAWFRTGGTAADGHVLAHAGELPPAAGLNSVDAASTTLLAIADSDIVENYPDLNTGASSEVWAGYDDRVDPLGGIIRGLIKFDLSSLPPGATIISATLRLAHNSSYGLLGQNVAITTHRVTSDWSESAVTWNNKPGYDGSYGSQSILHSDWGWFDFDVTSLVSDWQNSTYTNYGIMLRGPETSATGFRGFLSRETNSKPQLVIEYELAPGCTDVIVNGDFEQQTAWTTPGTQYTAGYTTDLARSGVSSMRTGIVDLQDNTYSYSSAYQTITLPDYADYITLNFWIFPQTGEDESIPLNLPENPLAIREEDAATTSDWQFVFILDRYGNELERLLYRRQQVDDWQYHSFDISRWDNRTIKVYFDTYNNGVDGITSMHVDDVSVQVCNGTPPAGSIAGSVALQGRSDHSGAQVCADNGSTPLCVQTDAAGDYIINDLEEGSYSVAVEINRYLDAEKLVVPVTSGNVTNLSPVTCLGGDTNDDCVINILDVTLMGSRFGMSCGDLGWDARADINNDCVINILDLSVTGSNFNAVCPVPWS